MPQYSLPDGVNVFKVRAINPITGEGGDVASVTVKIDTHPPIIEGFEVSLEEVSGQYHLTFSCTSITDDTSLTDDVSGLAGNRLFRWKNLADEQWNEFVVSQSEYESSDVLSHTFILNQAPDRYIMCQISQYDAAGNEGLAQKIIDTSTLLQNTS